MSAPYLKSGIFLAPFHNHDENPTLSMERDLELLEHLDRLNSRGVDWRASFRRL